MQVQQLGLALYNGHAGFKFGGLDIGGQAPLKAGAQTILQAFDLLGRAIAGDHDLAARVVQRVEGVEEFFLCTFLARNKLDIVYQQKIGLAIALAEHFGRV